MGKENWMPLDMPDVPFIPPEEKPGWKPVPLPADLPDEYEPENDPSKKPPETDENPKQKDEIGEGVVLDRRTKKDSDDRDWNPMKEDDEM